MRHIELTAQAVRCVEAHLDERLTLDRVARELHYSKYHLHRVFTRTLGLTLHDYTQRRQLTDAAHRLVHTSQRTVDIALGCGFESQQSFANTFKAMYKQTPGALRAAGGFYPLQWAFPADTAPRVAKALEEAPWEVVPATSADIPRWMRLVRQVVDGFPHLEEHTYRQALARHIAHGSALLLTAGDAAIGAALFSPQTGHIGFLAVHPLCRGRGAAQHLLEAVADRLPATRSLHTTTYRAGDRADPGYRRSLFALGFVAEESLVEFGYPTQRFVLPRPA